MSSISISGMEQFFGVYRYAGNASTHSQGDRTARFIWAFGQQALSKVARGQAQQSDAYRAGEGAQFSRSSFCAEVPMVGEKTYQTLCDLGVRKVKTLQEMPVDLMEQ